MTQPKDKEQFKKEARVHLLSIGIKSDHDIETIIGLLEKSHSSGRESMRDECVEEIKKEAATYKKVYLSAAFGRALASSLKKIKP